MLDEGNILVWILKQFSETFELKHTRNKLKSFINDFCYVGGLLVVIFYFLYLLLLYLVFNRTHKSQREAFDM